MRWPALALIWVVKPSMLEEAGPDRSHSLFGFPGFWFSRTIGFAVAPAASAVVCVEAVVSGRPVLVGAVVPPVGPAPPPTSKPLVGGGPSSAGSRLWFSTGKSTET